MIIKIKKSLYTATKAAWAKPFDACFQKTGYREPFEGNRPVEIDLKQFTQKNLLDLKKALGKFESKEGVKTLLRDITAWLSASLEDAGEVRARTTRQAMDLLLEYMLKQAPGKLLFTKPGRDEYPLGYYLNEIEYYRPDKEGYGERLELELYFIDFGEMKKTDRSIWAWNCVGETPKEILESAGLEVETAELRKQYNAYEADYVRLHDKVGLQCLAKGLADDRAVDGNPSRRRGDDDWWMHGWGLSLRLDAQGEPSRVVIDVFKESERESRGSGRERSPNPYFWQKNDKNRVAKQDYRSKEAELDVDEDYEDEEGAFEEAKKQIFVPRHPHVAVFDLKRHLRLKIHVGNLTEYTYNKELRQHLVLPEVHLKLLDTLLSEKNDFQDIVKGKTGGTIIICQGPPGTGKTMTAEVYSEFQERPLYSVQCAQLGVDPEELESNLLKVLARGRRWNAVILLDEGDVYLHERGSDLIQNAVVGVFLRLLEYNENTMFITTNRGDHVDDAILSRCTAQIRYSIPTKEEQEKIWRTLVVANKIVLPRDIVLKIAAEYPTLSGRDVKNLLKLANLMARQRKVQITPELIREAKQFKPAIGAYTWETEDSTSPSKPGKETK